MAPALVFRIQDRDGHGPFTSARKHGYYMVELDAYDNIPTPEVDGLPYSVRTPDKNGEYRFLFGYSTIAQLFEVFTKHDCEMLRQYGFRIARWVAPPGTIRFGNSGQCAFLRLAAIPTELREDL